MTATMPAPPVVTPQPDPPAARTPRWERPALVALLVLAGALHLWGAADLGVPEAVRKPGTSARFKRVTAG